MFVLKYSKLLQLFIFIYCIFISQSKWSVSAPLRIDLLWSKPHQVSIFRLLIVHLALTPVN